MTKIFLDMDGVLVDFVRGCFDVFHVPDQPVGKYEFFGSKEFPPTFPEVNEKCDREFWRNLEWTDDGRKILELVEQFWPPNVLPLDGEIFLLTHPMPNVESWTGKYEWVTKNLPLYREKLTVTRNCKSAFAAPNHVLIDDKEQNIEAWVWAGGKGILVPRPWNFLRNVNTLDFIRGELFDINPHPIGKVIK